MIVLFTIASALVLSGICAAQTDAPGESVIIPGAVIPGWGKVDQVPARFGLPEGTKARVPAVLILHGSGGVDGRGAFYAKALQQSGIATLEITMFRFGGRPIAGFQATMPHAAAALRWLDAQPTIDGKRLGVMGFSWGGAMTVLLSSELVREHLGKDTPRPAAFAPLYPVCSSIARSMKSPGNGCYDAQTRMSASPMLIQVGTSDDYEENERSCDALVAMWPASARELATVRHIKGATHAFDYQRPAIQFYDPFSHNGRGGMVSLNPSPKDADEASKGIVRFFVRHLNP